MCCVNTTVVLDKSTDIRHDQCMDKEMMTTEQINNLAKDIAELTCEEFVDYQYDIMVDDLCALFEQNEHAARSYDNDAIDYGKKI
jgi:hypothetical protein